MTRFRLSFLSPCSFFLTCTLFAQTSFPGALNSEALYAERPGFTVSSAPVGLGVLQLENGNAYEWARQSGSKLKTFTRTQTLLRFGLTSSLEIRFTTNGYSWQTAWLGPHKTVLSGLGAYSTGFKYRLFRQKDLRPEISVIGTVSLPARGSSSTTPRHDPSLAVAATKDLPHKLNIALSANFASTSDDEGRIFNAGQSVWLTRSFKPVSLFAEVFHTIIARGLGSQVVADLGFYRNLGRYAQFDLEAGHTLTGQRPSLFTSAGIVIPRIRNRLCGA